MSRPKKPRPKTALAVKYPWGPGDIDVYSVAGDRETLILRFGAAYAKLNEEPKKAWRRAYRKGFRIIRVEVRARGIIPSKHVVPIGSVGS